MNCPHCAVTTTQQRTKKTKLGYTPYFCQRCQRTFNERTGTPYMLLLFQALSTKGWQGSPCLISTAGESLRPPHGLTILKDRTSPGVPPLMMVDNSTITPIRLTVPSNSPYDQEALSFSHFKQRG